MKQHMENSGSERQNRRLLLVGGFAFAALLTSGLFMTVAQGETLFLKSLVSGLTGCLGLF